MCERRRSLTIHISTLLVIFASATMDPVRDLNSHLQQYRDAHGNLTRHFSWLMEQEGPENQKVHYATAKLHGQVIGTGSGVSMVNAKHMAASRALQHLQTLPPSHPMFSLR